MGRRGGVMNLNEKNKRTKKIEMVKRTEIKYRIR